jgi:hypothetical protein
MMEGDPAEAKSNKKKIKIEHKTWHLLLRVKEISKRVFYRSNEKMQCRTKDNSRYVWIVLRIQALDFFPLFLIQ